MWIEHGNDEIANMDCTQSIELVRVNPENKPVEYVIKMYQRKGNYVFWYFDTEDERQKYFDALKKILNCVTIPTLSL